MLVYHLLYYIFFLVSYIYIKYKLLYTINIYNGSVQHNIDHFNFWFNI